MSSLLAGIGGSLLGGLLDPIKKVAGNVIGKVVGGATNVLSKIPIIGGLFKGPQEPAAKQQVQPQVQYNPGQGFGIANQIGQFQQGFNQKLQEGMNMWNNAMGDFRRRRDESRQRPGWMDGVRNAWGQFKNDMRNEWNGIRDQGREMYRQGRDAFNQARDMGRQAYDQVRNDVRNEYRQVRDMGRQSWGQMQDAGRQVRQDWHSFR